MFEYVVVRCVLYMYVRMSISWMMGVEMILDGAGRTFVDLFIKIEENFPNANKLVKCTAHLTCYEIESSANSGRHQNSIKYNQNTRTFTATMLLRLFYTHIYSTDRAHIAVL